MGTGMAEQTQYVAGSLPCAGSLLVGQSTSFIVLSVSCGVLSAINSIYYLYALIRRPRLILDFALTLVFNHLVLTTYYSASIPTSLFFWIVMVAGSVMTVILAEQLCVKREMNEGLSVVPSTALLAEDEEDAEEMEMGGMSGSRRD